MYKNKDKQRATDRERQRRHRKGVTPPAGGEGVTDVLCVPCRNYEEPESPAPLDILDKLTNPFWRDRLTKICAAFEASHNPRYKEDVWIGGTNLALACDWLACTASYNGHCTKR